MPCSQQSENKSKCNCTYPCARKGNCCECIRFHRSIGELPACFFSTEFEKTYDRSIANYLNQTGKK